MDANLAYDDSVNLCEDSGLIKTPNLQKLDLENDKLPANRPLSQKQSARYSAGGGDNDLSSRGNNLLCESEGSVLHQDDSLKINDDFTPDALAAKNKNNKVPKPCKTGSRQSYNRGAF